MEPETVKLIIAIPFVVLSAVMICGGMIGLFFVNKWQIESKQILMQFLADYSESMLRTIAIKNYKEKEGGKEDSQKTKHGWSKIDQRP